LRAHLFDLECREIVVDVTDCGKRIYLPILQSLNVVNIDDEAMNPAPTKKRVFQREETGDGLD